MAAYVIVTVGIRDPEPFQEYLQKVTPIVERYGGRYLAVSTSPESVEGGWQPQLVVLLEFDSTEAARTCYHSPEYQAILPIRLQNTYSQMILVDGL